MESITKYQYDLLAASDKSIQVFSLENRVLLGKVVDVYDGDTCKVNVFLYDNVLKQFTIRMSGYDCPELRTKNLKEKTFGIRSKDIMSKLVSNKIVKIQCFGFDKYGRLLAKIFVRINKGEDLDVNKFMLDHHLGYSYEGKTKSSFDDLLSSGYYKDEKVKIPDTIHYPSNLVPSSEEKPKKWWCFCCPF